MEGKYVIGIDISKNDFKACFLQYRKDLQASIKASRTFTNTAKGTRDFLAWSLKHQKEQLPLCFVMEATGAYHEPLAWFLYQADQLVSIVLPDRAKAYKASLGLKSKNDKVDARNLAYMGATQALARWQPISKQIYGLRALTRHLEDLQQLRTSLLNQQEQLKYSMYPLKEVNKSVRDTIKALDKQIARCKEKIQASITADENLHKKVAHMCTIKGVSTMTVAVIIAETNGFALISNQRQLTSYAGYDVKENQSGNRVGKTRITKKGNAHIRRAMHLPAFNMVRYQVKTFENLYNRVYAKTGIKMKAYVAIQAKLLRMLYTLWNKEVDFDTEYYKKTAGTRVPAARDELSDRTPSPLLVL